MSDQQLVDALNALVRPKRRKELKALEARGVLPGRRAVALYDGRTGTAGIASPLTEQVYASRQYHENRYLPTTDGIFTIVEKPIKQITQQDANGALVIQQFAQPT